MKIGSTARSNDGPILVVWHLLAVALVVLLPTLVRLHVPFWALSERMLPQVSVLAVGYLGTALLLSLSTRRSTPVPPWSVVLGAAVAFGAPFYFLIWLVGLDYSRLVMIPGVALGFALAVMPHLLAPRPLRSALAALALVSVAVIAWAASGNKRMSDVAGAETRGRISDVVSTVLHDVRITRHRNLVAGPPASGGGLVRVGDEIVVANGRARFHRLRWEGFSLVSEPMELPPLLERDAFIADNSAEVEGQLFRVMDLLLDTASTPPRLLVSHYHWDREERCVALRVSAIALPDGAASQTGRSWRTVYTTDPCVPVETTIDRLRSRLTNHIGGRMAWGPSGGLLLTVGDLERDGIAGLPMFAQDPANDYGKILVIEPGGGAGRLTVGHRNPQGLLVARDGTIWSTEHGPTGGDELNLIVPGRNYGWPLVTYGTENGLGSWPPAEGRTDHGPFEEPVHAWLPSVAASQLVEVRGEQFPAWDGDLLVATLVDEALFRMRIRSGRAIYAERIPIGNRLRDIEVDPEGRVLVWTDEGELVSLANAGAERASGAIDSRPPSPEP